LQGSNGLLLAIERRSRSARSRKALLRLRTIERRRRSARSDRGAGRQPRQSRLANDRTEASIGKASRSNGRIDWQSREERALLLLKPIERTRRSAFLLLPIERTRRSVPFCYDKVEREKFGGYQSNGDRSKRFDGLILDRIGHGGSSGGRGCGGHRCCGGRP
jgi:hypothetical protein